MFNLKTPLENLRIRVASAEALPQLSLLGLLTGLLAGGGTVAFRLAVDLDQIALLPSHQVDDFESLDWLERLLFPIVGGLGIGLLQELAHTYRAVGVVHVLERIAYYQGRLPWRNALQQFVTGALSIICGHSVGREGPSVHLGAAGGSLLGQWLELPNNALRTLVACGIAAAIAASFNTPLAGVLFSMEVILMQYQLAGIAPIILAAVVGAAISWAVFGPSPAFFVPPTEMHSLLDFPYLVLIGFVVGILAAVYNRLMRFFFRVGEAAPRVATLHRCWAASRPL